MFKFKKESGQVARLLLVLAVIVFVAIIITFLIVQMASKPPKPVVPAKQTVPLPVYETKLGNINFSFISATDKGNTLKTSDIVNANYSQQKNLQTTERFIEVVIGAQNQGTNSTDQGAWDIANIVDSNGRIFSPDDNYIVAPWLPAQNFCGALLKPAFNPTSCIKIYEVAKVSTGLKIQVQTGIDNSANNFSSNKRLTGLIDLIVK